MGDAACEGPPFPSKLVSKHIPSAKKTPICGIYEVDQDVTASYNLVEPGLPVSPLQGGPAFPLARVPVLCEVFLMYGTGA